MSEIEKNQLEDQARRVLQEVLSVIPSIEADPERWERRTVFFPADFASKIELRSYEGLGFSSTELTLEVIVRSHAHPRQLRSTLYAHREKHRDELNGARVVPKYTIYISPFVSSEAADICREEGVGYLDFGGNCHIEFGNVYVHVEGKPNQHKEERSLKNLFADKSARILRVLLEGPLRGHKVTEIAARAQVSLGLVSKVRNHLIDQELAVDTDDGVCIVQPDKLLDSWTSKDSFLDRTNTSEYALLEIDFGIITAKLEQLLRGENIDFAYTQWSAAYNRAAHTVPPIISCYVDRLPDETLLKSQLSARSTFAGSGRLRLILSKDFLGVTIGKQEVKGKPQVSDLQTYLDLYGAGLRSDEQVEELRKLEDFNGGWNINRNV